MEGAIVNLEDALAHDDGADHIRSGDWAAHREAKGLPRVRVKDQVVRAQRRLDMALLAASGKSLRKIADEMGLAFSTVRDEIEALIVEYAERSMQSLGKRLAREFAVLDQIHMEALIAWFDSKEGKVVNQKKRVKEIRSAFVKGNRSNSINQVKAVPVAHSENAQTEELMALFRDPEALVVPGQNGSGGEGLTIQVPTEKDEEYERTESSPGDPRYLQIILDCHVARCKLGGYYKQDDEGKGADAYTALTVEQRRKRLLALKQDLLMAKALAEGELRTGGLSGVGPIMDVEANEVHAVPVALPPAQPLAPVAVVPPPAQAVPARRILRRA